MSMSAGGGKGGANSDINVTPLVDVCLVLLIIFMVMVPRNVPELSVRIPPESKTTKPPNPTDEKPLVIGLAENGAISLNKNVILEAALGKELERQLEPRDKKAVFVDFEGKAKYGKAVELVDLARRSGAEIVGIMRDKDYKMPETLRR
ncbi:MAG: biopolymer transporter ExbD [Nannocystaceae bacterium]|nr:biopolymer transporter ExbD [Nannocystaceae bacterium]